MLRETRIKQKQRDQIALKMTRQAIEERRRIDEQRSKWIPKSVNDENGLFSKKVPYQKPLRKSGAAAKVSINIFQLGSDFKPTVRRSELSTKNSDIFLQSQQERVWRSSSKSINFAPIQKQQNSKKCFKASELHRAKSTSINLAWDHPQKMADPKLINSKTTSKREQQMFQRKKRTNLEFNYSSIKIE